VGVSRKPRLIIDPHASVDFRQKIQCTDGAINAAQATTLLHCSAVYRSSSSIIVTARQIAKGGRIRVSVSVLPACHSNFPFDTPNYISVCLRSNSFRHHHLPLGVVTLS
jgi:hypothetical protein